MAPRSDESGTEPRGGGGAAGEGEGEGGAAGAVGDSTPSPAGTPPSPQQPPLLPPLLPQMQQPMPEAAAAYALAAAVAAMLDQPRPESPPPRPEILVPDDGSDDEILIGNADNLVRFRTYRDAVPPPPPPAPVVLPPFVRVNPPPLGQPDGPDYLPVDHNLPQLLRQVTGSNDLAAVESVRVRVVARETSLQRLCLYMPRLRELHLDGSRLGSLRDLGCGLSCLEVLSVANCGLDSLDGTFGLMTLKELRAVDNAIDDVSSCTGLPHIQVIDLKRNAVQDIRYIGFLSICNELKSLCLTGCPVSRLQGYRGALIDMLPQLQILDGLSVHDRGEVSDEEGFYEDGGDDVDEESEVYPRANASEEEAPSIIGSASGEDVNDSMFNNVNTTCDTSLKQLSDLSRSMSEDNSSISTQDDSSSSSGYLTARNTPFTDRRASTPLPKTVRKMVQSARMATAFGSKLHLSEIITGKRPSSASTSGSSLSSFDDCGEAPVPLLRSDAPSLLTSGTVMCGTLASALRARRNRANAWAEALMEDPAEDKKSSAGNNSSDPHNSTEFFSGADNAHVEDNCEKDNSDNDDDYVPSHSGLLEKSRRWREIFKTYRTENRAKWENEKDDIEGDGVNGEQREEVNETKKCERKEESTDSEEKEQGSNNKDTLTQEKYKRPPCCAMMHMWRMQEKGIDSDSIKASDSSTQPSRSGSRGHEFMRF